MQKWKGKKGKDFSLRFLAWFVCGLFLAFGLFACGGGGGGGGGEGGGGGGEGGGVSGQKAFYLVYKDYTNYDLYLVDPASPKSPYKVPHQVNNGTGKITNVTEVLSFNYDNNTKTLKDTYPSWLFYKEVSDIKTSTLGTLYKISLLKGNSGYPQPEEVDEKVCEIEDSKFGLGYWYVRYKKDGGNGDCSNTEEYLVDSNNSKPIDLGTKKIVDVFTGGMNSPNPTGYLVVENGTFENCSLDFKNCPSISGSPNIQDWKRVATNYQNGNVYVCVDNTLYKVTPTTATTLNVPCGTDWDYKSDMHYIYALDTRNHTLYVFDYNGTQNGSPIDDVNNFDQTTNYLIISTSNELKALKKDLSETIFLGSAKGVGFRFLTSSTNGAYWDEDDFSTFPSTIKACYWKEGDLKPTCKGQCVWAGFSRKRSFNFSNYNGGQWIYRLLRMDATIDITNNTIRVSLVAVNPSDMSTLTLGSEVNNILIRAGLGKNMLLGSVNATTNRSDVFFADLSKADSFQNITNTPDTEEWPVELRLN